MDARVQTETRFLPALAEAIADWFPELNRRSFAVSDATITKENVPTLPLVMVAFTRSTGEQALRNRQDQFEIADAFVVEFWLEPARYKRANGGETPFWSYYNYEYVRDTLLENLARWEAPGGERIAYRSLTVEADALAVTLTFGFIANMRWCAQNKEQGIPFSIGFGLCTPASCVPDTCYDDKKPLAEYIEPTPPVIKSAKIVGNVERTVLKHVLRADDVVVWTIVGGEDAGQFQIDGSKLQWTDDGVRDFNNPQDANADNDYIVTVRATNILALTAEQTITVRVVSAEAKDNLLLTTGDDVLQTDGSLILLKQEE